MADSQRKTANLFDKTQPTTLTNKYLLNNGEESSFASGWAVSAYIPVSGNYVTLSGVGGNLPSICAYDSNKQFVRGINYGNNNRTTVNISDCSFVRFSYVPTVQGDNAMLNYGSTALPYEPYWQHSLRKLTTSTDTLTTLPADLYADGNNATVGLVGNMHQSGTPTPQNPIQPSECGDLETEGAKAGQYKIPISSGNTTTPVYLGEVESTRQIYKLVFNGTESGWRTASGFFFNQELSPDYLRAQRQNTLVCSHYQSINQVGSGSDVGNNQCSLYYAQGVQRLYFQDSRFSTLEEFTTYLQQQYANGTPVTVWYVLATETTGIVNEPLRKIGNYADIVSGITIPTIAGANALSVDTTVQPSEATVNYKGWHPVADVHEKSRNVMPAGEQKTVESNGVTFSSDGNGRYRLIGTASAYAAIRFNLVSGFTTPISVSNGGLGTLSFFNNLNYAVALTFCNGATNVDSWQMSTANRTNTAYNAIGNKYVDNIVISVTSGATVDITIMPEFTNDGVLPSEYEPYWT